MGEIVAINAETLRLSPPSRRLSADEAILRFLGGCLTCPLREFYHARKQHRGAEKNVTSELHQSIRNIPMPERMRRLPLTETGFPVLFFADYVDGKPDLRIMDGEKFALCYRKRLCWLCGDVLGRHMTFVLGPMCTITRTSSELPCHRDCAAYAVRACPFLTRPHARYRRAGLPQEPISTGMALDRNPGCCALWTTRSYSLFRTERTDGKPGYLVTVGEPETVEWFAEGRIATRAEVDHSINGGLPELFKACDLEKAPAERDEARRELEKRIASARRWLPMRQGHEISA